MLTHEKCIKHTEDAIYILMCPSLEIQLCYILNNYHFHTFLSRNKNTRASHKSYCAMHELNEDCGIPGRVINFLLQKL